MGSEKIREAGSGSGGRPGSLVGVVQMDSWGLRWMKKEIE